MRRGLLHAMAWTLATSAAVTLSWWGVHTVMSGTAYDPPLAVPLTTRTLSTAEASTQRSDPPDSPSPSASPSESAPASPSADPASSSSAKPSPKAPTGDPATGPASSPRPSRQPDGEDPADVKGYTVSGGRVVFDLGTSSAELVSATPAAGWRMQVWKQDFWIRVTFTLDSREVSVFCTWHDHPPLVQVDER
ncbi:hypothetical protein MTF65_07490 [Streptomyces sp. APSN-46.1]|uniref:hypothetical protein n=1 Tax=Streptomyces sp. APSN-46.1 TaxID=2929049 RepID=UPI001FB260FF|nr:hypothetical protein [Streptomyces sp. APSN-46.1]MCJ1677185.1 hypothetical protein [Streptomyces sp. APSN-46.1]